MALPAQTLEMLGAIVGADHVRADPDSLAHYGRDTCDLFSGAPGAIVFPSNTEEVRRIVVLANEQGLALVPSGGRTGLSGGATATGGEIVVSMGRMNRILGHSVTDQTVVCQAGVETARVQQKAQDMGLYYPVDFASSGSSHIAGNIATNAGGNRVIRYGMTRNWVAALEVVTGSGEVLRLGRELVKDNSGYDLRQLIIGSEGTLGIITEATMRLVRPPAESHVAVLGLESMRHLIPVLERYRDELVINAFEFFTEETLVKVIERHGLQRPFATGTPVYALVEFEGPTERDVEVAMAQFEHCLDKGWVQDGVLSQNIQQARDLWRLREDISSTLAQWSPYKNDLSVRVSAVPEFIEEVDGVVQRRYPDFEVLWYGHIGDGNMHLNILKPEGLTVDSFKANCGTVSDEIFEIVQRFEGSVSAEHGIGLLKRSQLHYTRAAEEIVLMRTIKKVLDPRGVLNPGKVL